MVNRLGFEPLLREGPGFPGQIPQTADSNSVKLLGYEFSGNVHLCLYGSRPAAGEPVPATMSQYRRPEVNVVGWPFTFVGVDGGDGLDLSELPQPETYPKSAKMMGIRTNFCLVIVKGYSNEESYPNDSYKRRRRYAPLWVRGNGVVGSIPRRQKFFKLRSEFLTLKSKLKPSDPSKIVKNPPPGTPRPSQWGCHPPRKRTSAQIEAGAGSPTCW
jgi:hypothetical protein